MSSAAVLKNSEKECRRLAQSHYENFLVTSVFLPRRLRQPVYNIYAFCRTADDLADESSSCDEALAGLADLQQQLDMTFAGNPPAKSPRHPNVNLFPALAHTIDQFQLSKRPFDDLISAFRQDQNQIRYDSFEDVVDYCRRSANPIGRIFLCLVDSYNDQNVALVDEICTGFQLSNFWQDVARDRQMGRVYLPQDEMQRFSVTDEMLAQSSAPQALRNLLKSECDRAEAYFRRGLPLANRVPRWFANDVKLYAQAGLATLRAIRRIDYDVLAQRPKVGKTQHALLIARAMVGWL